MVWRPDRLAQFQREIIPVWQADTRCVRARCARVGTGRGRGSGGALAGVDRELFERRCRR